MTSRLGLGFTLLLAFSLPAHAANSFKIDVEYLAAGAAVPRTGSAIVDENESAKLQMADTLVRFLPSTTENGDVKINALIVQHSGKSDHIVGQPSVIVHEGQPAEISESDADGKLLYKIRFTSRVSASN